MKTKIFFVLCLAALVYACSADVDRYQLLVAGSAKYDSELGMLQVFQDGAATPDEFYVNRMNCGIDGRGVIDFSQKVWVYGFEDRAARLFTNNPLEEIQALKGFTDREKMNSFLQSRVLYGVIAWGIACFILGFWTMVSHTPKTQCWRGLFFVCALFGGILFGLFQMTNTPVPWIAEAGNGTISQVDGNFVQANMADGTVQTYELASDVGALEQGNLSAGMKVFFYRLGEKMYAFEHEISSFGKRQVNVSLFGGAWVAAFDAMLYMIAGIFFMVFIGIVAKDSLKRRKMAGSAGKCIDEEMAAKEA